MSTTRRYTVLITDLVDSTKLATELGDSRVVEVWLAHDRAARDLLPLHNGWEVDKSDGFLMLFERTLDGVRYALAYHAALRRLSAELGLKLRARAGLHAGEVSVIRTPPEDIARGAKQWEVEGLAKPTAARIMSVALGGQTLLSGATAAEIPEDRGDIRLISHGHYRMKGVAEPMEVVEAGGVDAPLQPPPDAAKVYRVVQTADGWRPAREVPNNLSPPRVGFFGRGAELRGLADLIEEGARLVTLVGSGGTGKTSLALRYGQSWMGDWPGGVWVVELAEARNAVDVARALAQALGVPLAGTDPVETVGAALASRESALIILDNFEQLVSSARATVGRWMDLAPQVCWLVTSRQRLGLRGERVFPVEPLALPSIDASSSDLEESPAVQLFLDRARAVSPTFSADAAQLQAIARLTRLLDGLPLAIELAAARVRVLPPQGILDRMGRRFDLLKGGARAATDRQGTLRRAIDWSWDLLEPWGRLALAQLSVFEGDFDLDAVEAVLDLSAIDDAPWPMDVLESLVDQSLVRAISAGQGGQRFSLLQSIRDYAAEKLVDPGAVTVDGRPVTGPEAQAHLRRRHARHYARWGERGALDTLHQGRAARHQLEMELDNVVAAASASAAMGEGALSAGAALGAIALLASSGPFSLAVELGERARAASPPPALAARLAVALGEVHVRAGQPQQAEPLLRRALESARALGDLRLEGEALAALGREALLGAGLELAQERFEEALRLHRSSGDRRAEADTLVDLAQVIGVRGGQHTPARALLDTALALYAARGDEAGEANARSILGALCANQGDLNQAHEAYTRARDLARLVGDRRMEGLSEGMLASVFMVKRENHEARPHFEAALRIQSSIGDRVHEALHAINYAVLLVRLGERGAAESMLVRAITLARASRDHRNEGYALGRLGNLRVQAGALEAGLEALREGATRLKEAGDRAGQASLRCEIGLLELTLGHPDEARACLDEARRLVDQLGTSASPRLLAAIAELSARVGA